MRVRQKARQFVATQLIASLGKPSSLCSRPNSHEALLPVLKTLVKDRLKQQRQQEQNMLRQNNAAFSKSAQWAA